MLRVQRTSLAESCIVGCVRARQRQVPARGSELLLALLCVFVSAADASCGHRSQRVDMKYNRVSDLSSLSGLRALKVLNASHNDLTEALRECWHGGGGGRLCRASPR